MRSGIPTYLTGLLAALLAVPLAVTACSSNSQNAKPDDKPGTSEEADFEYVDSDKIPVGDSPTLGPEDAPVTIVEFGDFQCPFCAKGTDRLEKLRRNFGGDIRLVFKHFPLPFHKQADEAARAAMAAGAQDKFWEMHDLLYDRQDKFKSGSMKKLTAKWAGQIGLDVDQFKKDYEHDKWSEIIDRNQQLGRDLGVKGTPSYFINGQKLVGAQPYSKFQSVVSKQIGKAKNLRDEGTPDGEIYKTAVAQNLRDDSDGSGDDSDNPEDPITRVPVDDDDPVLGEREDFWVTVVVFSEFECQRCSQVVSLRDKLHSKFGDRVRFVFKHRPLGFHQHAERAARAAIAAQLQGKFWEMHDLLFDHQDQLGRPGLFVDLAEQLDLDVDQFKEDLASDEVASRLDADDATADEVGANGTPNFFVNGRQLAGLQPYSKLEQLIEEQMKLGKKLQNDEDLDGDALYKAVVKANKDGEKVVDESADTPDERADRVDRDKLEVGDSPTKGPDDAPVTIYEFSDFQCPYCGQTFNTLHEKVLSKPKYNGKIRVVHKNFPLEFHQEARPAAKAALAAQRQDKFWEMYDLLFNKQDNLSSANYKKWANKLGLNAKKFKKDLNDPDLDARIDDDQDMGKRVGVRGTPSFFINGYRLVGAQSESKFEEVIDKALDEAK